MTFFLRLIQFTLILLPQRAASSIISALGVILVAQILSPSEYGLVAIALIAPNLIQIIKDFGKDHATIKTTAQYNQKTNQQT